MGLLKGNVTFSRYRVVGDLPDHFPDFIDTKIKLFAFRNILSDEEKSMGWTSLENVLDTKFEYANYTLSNYIVFTLRIDKKVIPPSLLKIKVLEAEREYMADKGANKIYRQDRKDIKERVRAELMRTMSSIPSFYDVCWSPSKGWLLFGSLSEKVREDFDGLFAHTFDLKPVNFIPWDPQYMEEGVLQKMASAGMGTTMKELSSLGREFLTWLWFKTEERNGSIMIPGEGDIELNFIERLVLESGEGEYSETVVCRGIHADLEEGKVALRKGKVIREARLSIAMGMDQMDFSIKADYFQFQSMKMPDSMGGEAEESDREGRLLERIYLMEKALKTMERL
ncbi:MAG: hypothetical protein E4H39_01615, partial [Syntrophobacterales bacterium]